MFEIIQRVVDETPMNMLVAVPNGRGKHPGVLLSHYRHGLASFTFHNAQYLASHGFVVVAPDHFHHTPDESDPAKRKQKMSDQRLINDMNVATEFLRRHPRVMPEATAIMGHCMGGRQTLLGAATIPGFRCGIDCYGGGVMKALGDGPTVFERLSGIKCPIAGFFGAQDTNPPVDDVRKVAAELGRLGIDTEFHIYENTGHAFMDPEQARYVEASATAAWTLILEFLKRHTWPIARTC